MAVVPIEPDSPLRLDLTREYLTKPTVRRQPLYIGAAWRQRFQARDSNGEAIPLDDADVFIQMTISKGAATCTRKTGETSESAEEEQIVIDDDQSEETTDEDGNPIGTGWFTVRFEPIDADVTALEAVEGRGDYLIAIRIAAGDEDIHFAGKIDVLSTAGTLPLPTP